MKTHNALIKKGSGFLSFNMLGYLLTGVFALVCLLPFWITLAGSFTTEKYLLFGISLWPREFSLEGYRVIFTDYESIVRAYGITILTIVVGAPLCLLLNTSAAFVLQHKDFRFRKALAFYYFFTTLFSGGLLPYYILMTSLGLRNNILVLILPGLVNVFNIIIIRTYFQHNVPDSLVDAAKIDGAGNVFVYARIYLPLSVPVLATFGLFSAIGYWNQWSNAMLFITDRSLYPLQYLLYKIFSSIEFAKLIAEKTGKSPAPLPSEGFKLAMTVVTIGPIVLAYPFVQKYFVTGLTIGAIKG